MSAYWSFCYRCCIQVKQQTYALNVCALLPTYSINCAPFKTAWNFCKTNICYTPNIISFIYQNISITKTWVVNCEKEFVTKENTRLIHSFVVNFILKDVSVFHLLLVLIVWPRNTRYISFQCHIRVATIYFCVFEESGKRVLGLLEAKLFKKF